MLNTESEYKIGKFEKFDRKSSVLCTFCFRFYDIRWNVFGNIPSISVVTIGGSDAEQLIEDRPAYVLSLSELTMKAERLASPPPYDDPPSYDVAIAMLDFE